MCLGVERKRGGREGVNSVVLPFPMVIVILHFTYPLLHSCNLSKTFVIHNLQSIFITQNPLHNNLGCLFLEGGKKTEERREEIGRSAPDTHLTHAWMDRCCCLITLSF
jgi:hypothetical protein